MAKPLDDLLKLKGVIAAGEFSSDGKLINYRAIRRTSHKMS
jgi:roadblock/LC7 domain-containing protein